MQKNLLLKLQNETKNYAFHSKNAFKKSLI